VHKEFLILFIFVNIYHQKTIVNYVRVQKLLYRVYKKT